MKKSIQILALFMGLSTFFACNSTRIIDSWTKETLSDLKDNNVLIIAKSSDKMTRINGEDAFAKELEKRGISVTKSYDAFPNIDPGKEYSAEETQALRDQLYDKGYRVVLVSAIKDKSEAIVQTESGGYYTGPYYPAYYPRYYYGFNSYYGSVYSPYMGYTPSVTRTSKETTYVLETVLYDLNKSDDSQLVGITTASITDPASIKSGAQQYAAAIVETMYGGPGK